MKTIGILGDGAMAKAIIHLLKYNKVPYHICSRSKGNIEDISQYNIVFICISSEAVNNYLNLLQNVQILISCAKGVLLKNDPFISRIFTPEQFCVLSGPNFSTEIVSSKQTITTIASKNSTNLKYIAKILSTPFFQIEETDNVLGTEMCGILKNAIAIIMGYVAAGTESWNEKSLVFTRVFQESITVMKYFEIDETILNKSCGIGDLFLTCSSSNSRNYKFGFDLYHKQQKDGQTVEGVRTLEFLHSLNLELPFLKKLFS